MIPSEQNKAEDYLLSFFVSKKWRIVRHVGMIVVAAVTMFPSRNLTVEFLRNAGETNLIFLQFLWQ